MGILQQLSTLALRQLVDGACNVIGVAASENAVTGVVAHLSRHFTDNSLNLIQAVQKANDNAWRAMEVALAGESLWSWLDKADNKAFRQHVRAFLDATPLDGLPGHLPQFRQKCLTELREARKKGLFTGTLEPAALAREVGEFARFSDPEGLLGAEWQAISRMGKEFETGSYYHLSHLVQLKVGGPDNHALLVVAVRFFLRREIETNQELFQGMTWAKLELLQSTQDQALGNLHTVFTTHLQNVETMLESLEGMVAETHGVVLDIQKDVNQLAQRLDMLHRELRPRDSLSLQNDTERHLVKQLVERYRNLPEAERQQFPSLLNAIGKLEVAAGSFASAQNDFRQAAAISRDASQQAEAQYNLFGASLERQDWPTALTAIQEAAKLDRDRYAPFPLHKYEPERILGAGGFGVAFLCRNRLSDVRLVIKTLRSDTLERDMKEVFREAHILEQLDHPAIIRLRDCDYADGAGTRPYLVMDFFDGQTLEEYVKTHGTLSIREFVSLMLPVAEALAAAHERNILHRDIKPGNLLVRRENDGSWRVKVIDFGLALKQQIMHGTSVSAAVSLRTTLGYSIAGTMDYGAPEQMGKLPGVAVGTYSDIYGFARTCCYALFKTVQPLRKHWRGVPEELADLLEQCLSEDPGERLQSFAEVLRVLHPVTDQPAPKVHEAVPVARPGAEQGQGSTQAAELTMTPATRAATDWWKSGDGGRTDGEAVPIMTLQGHTDSVLAVVFSANGERLLSGGADGSVRLWDLLTGSAQKLLHGHADKVWNVAFLPGEKHAVSAGKDKTVIVWNLETGEAVKTYPNRTNRSLAVSPDGQMALTGNISDGMVRLWDLQNGREIRRFKGHMSWVLSLAFSPNGRQALSGSADGTLRLWDVQSGRELRRLQGHTDQVWCVVFAPGGHMALSSSADKTVRLWDLRTGKDLRCYNQYKDQIWSVAICPDGKLALSDGDAGAGRLWQLGQDREYPPLRGHGGKIMSGAFSTNHLAATASTDKTILVWKLPVIKK
jgi:tRNA A-37 threonylcarbamoyl transferase component Bud32